MNIALISRTPDSATLSFVMSSAAINHCSCVRGILQQEQQQLAGEI